MEKLVKACALLLAGLAVVFAIDAAWSAARAIDLLDLDGEARVGSSVDGGADSVPSWFVEEVLSLDGCADIRVWRGSGAIVGFTRQGESREVLSEIVESMRACGWVPVDSGSQMLSTLVKDSGLCKWAAVSCTEMEGETIVVVQCVREGG